jgi:hypothetical protein
VNCHLDFAVPIILHEGIREMLLFGFLSQKKKKETKRNGTTHDRQFCFFWQDDNNKMGKPPKE